MGSTLAPFYNFKDLSKYATIEKSKNVYVKQSPSLLIFTILRICQVSSMSLSKNSKKLWTALITASDRSGTKSF